MIKVDGVIVNTNAKFPDGSLAMKAPTPMGNKYMCFEWHYENDAELFALICLRRHYSYAEVTLLMPYCPHARLDRVKDPNDIFTLKYFCEIINSLNFKAVIINDVHSYVAPALLNNVSNYFPVAEIDEALNRFDRGHTALFFPDEGAMKRYGDKFKYYPQAFGIKKRDWTTGQILGLNIQEAQNIEGKDVLIVDDICSRGGTFVAAAKALKEAGAKRIGLYITHCENTILQGEVFTSGLISKVYTTDTLVHCDELKEKVVYVND